MVAFGILKTDETGEEIQKMRKNSIFLTETGTHGCRVETYNRRRVGTSTKRYKIIRIFRILHIAWLAKTVFSFAIGSNGKIPRFSLARASCFLISKFTPAEIGGKKS